jgi:hypothetical protein
MGRPKKSVAFDDNTEVPSGEDGLAESETDTLSDEDLIGEPEQDDAAGSEDDAAGSAAEDGDEDTEELPVNTGLPDGFMEMKAAPLSGIRVMLYTPANDYARAFYKRSRRFIDRRWQMSGKWCDVVTGKDVDFEPLGWRSLKVGE